MGASSIKNHQQQTFFSRIPPMSDALFFVVKSPLTSLITAVCIETAFIVSHCKNSITIATRGGKRLLFSCKSPHNRSERGCLHGILWKVLKSRQNVWKLFSGFFTPISLAIDCEASRAILNDCRDAPVISAKMLAFSLLKIRINRTHCLVSCHFLVVIPL